MVNPRLSVTPEHNVSWLYVKFIFRHSGKVEPLHAWRRLAGNKSEQINSHVTKYHSRCNIGTGVYITSLPPLTDTGQILWKNCDGQAPGPHWRIFSIAQCSTRKISQVLRNQKIHVTSGWHPMTSIWNKFQSRPVDLALNQCPRIFGSSNRLSIHQWNICYKLHYCNALYSCAFSNLITYDRINLILTQNPCFSLVGV
jgi:hypothetical protein